MTTHKHTPGPWAAHNGNNPEYYDIVAGVERVCSVFLDPDKSYSHTERIANAHLIAAAPELLSELKLLREWVRRPWGEDDGPENDVLVWDVDAAILKAEGGSE